MATQLELFPTEEPPLGGGHLLWLELRRERVTAWDEYPFNIPAVRSLERWPFHSAVTFLVGENGSGKSTLLEALALKMGFSAEGGTRHYAFSTRDTHSELVRHLRLARPPRPRPKDTFFLRAESFYTLMTAVEHYEREAAVPFASWSGKPPHERSHGEAFLTLLTQKLRGGGVYLFDEPEAALSPQRQLAVLTHFHTLVKAGSQLVVATHSPILLAYPHAAIWECADDGLREVRYEETEAYRITREFVRSPERMLGWLLEESADPE